ncbi:MAG: hypothetical protein Q9219_003551 [cf. Caloplaca sp. 3 TL-2023]
MDRLIISQDVAKLLPKMQVVVVAAYNINNKGQNPAVDKFAEESATSTLETLTPLPNAQSHPRIALYRDTLKHACNLSAKKFPQSNESLYKRLLKEKTALRPINPLVDFYNSVSIKHGVTAGAFDLAELRARSPEEPLELRLSTKEDTFKALDAGEGAEAVQVGEKELVYVQGRTVLTRHLAWRQAAEGLVTEGTRDVVFMSEVFHEGDVGVGEETALTKSVGEDFVRGLRDFFGVEGKVTVLGEGVGVRTAVV